MQFDKCEPTTSVDCCCQVMTERGVEGTAFIASAGWLQLKVITFTNLNLANLSIKKHLCTYIRVSMVIAHFDREKNFSVNSVQAGREVDGGMYTGLAQVAVIIIAGCNQYEHDIPPWRRSSLLSHKFRINKLSTMVSNRFGEMW